MTLGSGQTLGNGNVSSITIHAGTAGSGTIIDNTGAATGPVITASNAIGLVSHGATSAGDMALRISAPNLAVSTGHSLTLRNDQSFSIVSMNTLCSNTPINGISAGGSASIATSSGDIIITSNVTSTGDLLVVAPAGRILFQGGNVTSTGGSAGLYADGVVSMGSNTVTAAGTASVQSATSTVTQTYGSASVLMGDTVVIRSINSVGATGTPLAISAARLAAISTTGTVVIRDAGTGLAIGTYTLVDTSSMGGGSGTMTGVSAPLSSVAVTTSGAMFVNSDVSSDGDVFLVSTTPVASVANTITLNGGNLTTTSASGDIALFGNGAIALGNGTITAGATGDVSIVSTNGAITNNGSCISANTVALSAATGVGAPGAAVRLDPPTVAATSNGGIYVSNVGDLIVGDLFTISTVAYGGGEASLISGLSSVAGDVCVTTTGTLTVNSDITAGGDVRAVSSGAGISLDGGDVSSTAVGGNVGMYANGQISLGANDVTAGATSGTASLVSATDTATEGTGVVSGHTVVLQTATGIGTPVADFIIDAARLAAISGTGSIDIANTGAGLTIGTYSTVNTLPCGGASAASITGVSATLGDVCVHTAGNLTVASDVSGAGDVRLVVPTGTISLNGGNVASTGGGGNVALHANGTIALGSNNVGAGTTTGEASLVSVTGAITGGAGTVSGHQVALSGATGIGTGVTPVNLSTPTVAAVSAGGVYLSNIGDLAYSTLDTISTADCGGVSAFTITGVSSSGGNVCVATSGTMHVTLAPVAGNGFDLGLRAGGDIVLESGQQVGSASLHDVSLEAGASGIGTVIDNTASAAGTAVVTAGHGIALISHGASTGGDLTLTVSAPNLAVSAGGVLTLFENQTFDVTTLNTVCSGTAVTGVTSGGNLRLRGSNDITVLSSVSSTTGDVLMTAPNGSIALNGGNVTASAGSVALFANNGITLGTNNVTANGTSGEASLVSATGAITGGTGTVTAHDVAISGATGVGGLGSLLRLAASTLAAGTTDNGVFVTNAGALTIGALQTIDTSAFGGQTAAALTGVSSTNGVVAVTTTGALTVSNDVSGTSATLVSSGGGVSLSGGDVTATAGNGNVAIYGSGTVALGANDVTAGATSGEASIVSASGAITGGTGLVSGFLVALDGATGVGGSGTALRLSTPTVAARSTGGGVYLTRTGVLTIGTVSTLGTASYGGAAASQITGVTSTPSTVAVTASGLIAVTSNVTAGADLYLVSTGGGITLNGGDLSTTSASGDVALHASGGIALGTNNVSAGATSGTASLVSAAGAITGGTGVVSGYQAALSGAMGVGTAVSPVRVGTPTVAATSSGGGVYLRNTGALTIGALQTIDTSTYGGATAATISGVTSTTSDVAVTAGGLLTVSQNVTADGSNGLVSLVSTGDALGGGGLVSGHGIVLTAATTIGTSGTALEVSGATLAALGAGDLHLHSGGSLTVGTLSTIDASPVLVTGVRSTGGGVHVATVGDLSVSSAVTADTDVLLVSTGGDITLSGGDVSTTSGSGNVALYANGSIGLGASNVSAGGTSGEASLVSATGAITDSTGVVSAHSVALLASTGVGANGAPIRMSTPTVAAATTTGGIYLYNAGVLNVGTLQTIDTSALGGATAVTIAGLTTAGDLALASTGGLTISTAITGGADIYLVSSGGGVTLSGVDVTTTSGSGNVAVYANNQILLGSGSIHAGAISGEASLVSATGTVTETTGTISGHTAVLRTATSIGSSLAHLSIDASQLAAISSTGSVYLTNTATGLAIGTYSSISTLPYGGAVAASTVGVSAPLGDVCVETAGSLTVVSNVSAGGDVTLVTPGGAIMLNGGSVSSTGGSGDVALHADGTVAVGSSDVSAGLTGGEASVVSATGAITGGTGTVSGHSVALSAATGIGTSGTPLRTQASTVAAGSGSGLYLSNTGALTVGTLQTIDTSDCGGVAAISLTGLVSTMGDVTLTSTGAVSVASDVAAGGNAYLVSTGGAITLSGGNVSTTSGSGSVALHAAGTIAIGGGQVSAGAASGEASLVSTAGAITSGIGTVSGHSVALSATGALGASGARINLITPLVAATGGGVYLSNTGNLTVGAVTTIDTSTYGGGAASLITGITSDAADLLVTTSGSLTVTRDINGGANVYLTAPTSTITLNGGNVSTTSASGNVSLFADGLLSLGSNNVSAGATSGEASLVSANGAITGGSGVVSGQGVVLWNTAGIGSSGSPLLVDARTLAARSGLGIYLRNAGATTVGNLQTIDTSAYGGAVATTIDGLVSTTADVVLASSASITVGNAITAGTDLYLVSTGGAITLTGGDVSTTSNSGNVALHAADTIDLGSNHVNAGATSGRASLVSTGGAITDGSGSVSGSSVVLSGANGVGIAGAPMRLVTGSAAATSGGGVYLRNTGALTIGTLQTIDTSAYGGGVSTTVNGVTSAADLLVTTTGALTVTHDVAGGGNVYLVVPTSTITLNGGDVSTTSGGGNVALHAGGTIALDASEVTAGATSGVASLVSTGGAISGGTGTASGHGVVLSVSTTVGASGTPLLVSGGTLAAVGGGDLYLRSGGALTIGTLSTIDTSSFGGLLPIVVTGVQSTGGDVYVTTAGTLTVGSAVTGTNNVYLVSSGGGVALHGGVISTTSNAGSVAVHAANDISLGSGAIRGGGASGQASLLSAGGSIVGGTAVVGGYNVVLAANGGIGAVAVPALVDAAVLAVRGTTGAVYLVDQDLAGVNPGLTISALSTIDTTAFGGGASQLVSGASGSGVVAITTQGDLAVTQAVQGSSAGLRSVIGNVTIDAALAATGVGGTASAEANLSVQGTASISGDNIVFVATEGGVGTLLVYLDLHARTPGGVVTVAVSAGSVVEYTSPDSVTTGTVTTVVTGTPVVGVSGSHLCLEVLGDLILDSPVSGSSYGLRSLNGNVILNSTLTALAAGGTASIEAQGSISGAGRVVGDNVALIAHTGTIGTADAPFQVDAGNLAATGDAGVFIVGTRGFTVGTASTVCDEVPVTGVTSNGDISLTALTGDIVVAAPVSGRHVGIAAMEGALTVNNHISGTVQLDLQANGDITGSGTVAAPTVSLASTNGSVGGTGSPIHIEADVLAGRAAGQFAIVDPDGFTVGTATSLFDITPIVGVTAGTLARLSATTGTIVVQNDVRGHDVGLYGGSITFTTGSVLADPTSGTASLEATTGAITQVGGGGRVAAQGQTVVALAATSVGSNGAPVSMRTGNFAARAGQGDIVVTNDGPLTIVSATTLIGGVPINGVVSAGMTSITADRLTLAAPVDAGTTAVLQATNDIIFYPTGSVRAGQHAWLNSLYGSVHGTGGSQADVIAPDVVVTAGKDIGNTGGARLGVAASRFAARAGGNIAVGSVGGQGLTVSSLLTLGSAGTWVNGLEAEGDISVEVPEGDLTVTTVRSGGATDITVTGGSIFDATRGGETNITAGAPSRITARDGKVGQQGGALGVDITGALTVSGQAIHLRGRVMGDITIGFSPSLTGATFNGTRLIGETNRTSADGRNVFIFTNNALAQDNPFLGLQSFYLTTFTDMFYENPSNETEVNLDAVLQLADPELLLRKPGGSK